MADTLLAPDELGDLVDAPEFAAMPFAERQKVFETGVQDASQWVRDNGGWTPETWKGYGEAVGAMRAKVNESETFGETAGRYAKVVGQTLKDTAAMAGTTALDLGVVDPMTSLENPQFKVPGAEVGTALARGTVKALDAGGTLLAESLSKRNNEVETRLDDVKSDIDEGRFPFEAGAIGDWLQKRSDELEPHQSAWYQTAETMTEDAPAPEMQAWARANSLATPRHATRLAQYMQTRDPKVWDALKSDILRAPQAAQIQSDEDKQARDSTLGQFLDNNFGPGAGRMIAEAGDPFEWAGTLVPLFKGAKIVKKAGTIGSKVADVAKGVGAEMLSEQASLTADDPNATWEQRRQVAKDTLAGALGLTAAGAGIGMVGRRGDAGTMRPGDVVSAPTPNPGTPISDSGVLAQMAEVGRDTGSADFQSAQSPTSPSQPEAGAPRSAVAPVSVESGMFDAPAMEGDILRDFNVHPAAAGNQIDLNPPVQNQVSPPNVEIASVTPQPASPVSIPAAVSEASAPVVPTTDAGSTPAAGTSLTSAFTGIQSPAVAADIKTITDFEAKESAVPGLLTLSGTTLTPDNAKRLNDEQLEDHLRTGVESVVAFEKQPSVTELEFAQESATRLALTSAMKEAQARGMDVKGIMDDEVRRRGVGSSPAAGFKNLDTSGTTAGFLNTDIINEGASLSAINAIRRTSNFVSSALRWGTTKHLKPHADQRVKWSKSHVRNTAALLTKEMDNTFKVLADARDWVYDFSSGKFRDSTGNDITRARFESAVQLGNPSKSGIGLSTLQRAVITHSAIRAFERGETTADVLEPAQRGVAPSGILYFDPLGLQLAASTLKTIARQARDFAGFSRKAFIKFGEWIQPHLGKIWALSKQAGNQIADYLQGVWQAAVKNSQAGGSLPKGEKPMEQRSFGARVRDDPRVSEGAKDTLGDPLEYEPISNAETLAGANAVIDQNGLEAAAGMVMDDAVKMTDAQRVTLGMQTMMRLDQQAREAMGAGDAATAARLYNLMATVSEKTDKLGTALGQGVQAFAMWNRMTPEGALLQFEKRVREKSGGKMPRLPKELLGTLGTLRDQVNAMPEGSVLRADKMRELLAELARYEGIPMGSVFMAYWYANLLSGLSTQGVNVWGNGLNLMARTLAAGLANHPADTIQMIRGMIRNWRMAAGEARAAWAGQGSAKGNVKYDVPSVEKYAQQNALELMLSGKVRDWKYWTTKVMTLGGALKYVFRALTAADAAFWHTAAEGRVHLAASRAARQGHAAGSAEYVQSMAEQLGDGKAKFAEALQQAADEMKAAKLPVTTSEQNRRAWQIVEQSRPMPAREEAHRFGDLTTFAQEPEGFAGVVYSILQRAQNAKLMGVPVLRPFVPFARIVSNLMSQGMDWTPVGIARGIRGQHLFGGDKFDSWERKERAAAGVIGTTLAGLVASAAFSNKDEDDKDVPFMIYGMGPPDKAKRAQMPKGWKPHTIKIGDRYISYAETPLVFALAPVGAGLDKMRYGSQFNEASWGARAWYLMQGGGKALFSQGVLSSLGDLVGTMQGDVKPEKLPAKFTGGAVPFSGLMRDIVPLFDPTKISDTTIASSIFRDIPVVRGIAGKPSLNVFGEPVKAEGWQRVPVVKRFYDTAKNTDKEADFLARNKLWLPGTPQHGEIQTGDYLTRQQKAAIGLPASSDRRAVQMARMQARLLTPEESYAWQKRAGELTRERITALRKATEESLTPVDPDALQKRVNAMVEVSRRLAMSEMIMKLR